MVINVDTNILSEKKRKKNLKHENVASGACRFHDFLVYSVQCIAEYLQSEALSPKDQR